MHAKGCNIKKHDLIGVITAEDPVSDLGQNKTAM